MSKVNGHPVDVGPARSPEAFARRQLREAEERTARRYAERLERIDAAYGSPGMRDVARSESELELRLERLRLQLIALTVAYEPTGAGLPAGLVREVLNGSYDRMDPSSPEPSGQTATSTRTAGR